MTDKKQILAELNSDSLVIVGVPSDENSSYLRGTAKAPEEIMKALHSDSSNTFSENGIDITALENYFEFGNLTFNEDENEVLQIEEQILPILERKSKIISLGGDHAVSYPLIKAHSKFYKNITIIHFDAHPDLYDEFEGNKYSHACPFARVMEEKLVSRMISIGIRTANKHQKEQAEKFGVETIEMKNWEKVKEIKLNSPVYISLDLDVLDPAFAPGLSHYEPGGASVRQVIEVIQNINAPIIGADIVELNPERDINGFTAMVAVKFLKEIAAKMSV